jgi:hypothetical protein
MSKQKRNPETAIYQLKVSLKGAKPPIWRRIQVYSNTRLSKLHSFIQATMGWEDYHLHGFRADDVNYGIPDPDFGDEDIIDEGTVTLDQVLTQPKQKMMYDYDFGDDWQHDILLEKILPLKPDGNYPRCVTGKRACPPEDCGGIWGYYEFLEAIRDPDHPEHEDMLEWAGGDFDPEAFDRDEVNDSLQALQAELTRLGHQPPRYSFILNPYRDARFTKCPQCDQPTRLRKFALLIHVDDLGLLAHGKTCRFCTTCEILIAHQDELEAQMAANLNQAAPEAIGNEYLVIGTLDRKVWRRSLTDPIPIPEMLEHAADFEVVLTLEPAPGWYPA